MNSGFPPSSAAGYGESDREGDREDKKERITTESHTSLSCACALGYRRFRHPSG